MLSPRRRPAGSSHLIEAFHAKQLTGVEGFASKVDFSSNEFRA
jgi:hypothetical protein